MNGKLIVLEGTDGSGKSTQFARLCARISGAGIPYQKLVFPQYEEPSSALIRMYLDGEFGQNPGDVNPYAASAFYAVDRFASFKKVWENWYREGGLVLADRYTTSNAVHQGSKCRPEDRLAFFRWLSDFEYRRMGLPAPDLVLYLDMPTPLAVQLLRSREAQTNTRGDIHELDAAYLAACRQTALEAAAYFGWARIPCAEAGGELRSIERIHCDLWAQTAPLLGLAP